MSTQPPAEKAQTRTGFTAVLGWTLFALMVGALVGIAGGVLVSPLRQTLATLFGAQTGRMTWYITRAAGIITYLLLWFSTIWGLGVASKIFDRFLNRSFTFDFHEFISLLSLGFLGLHIVVLTADTYLPYNLAQLLVPFLSPYRPLWVGIGVLALYLSALVTVTYYLRQRIGMKTFRSIHVASLVAYLAALFHGIFSGTDSSMPAMLLVYAGTFLVFVFLSVYWWMMRRQARNAVAPVKT